MTFCGILCLIDGGAHAKGRARVSGRQSGAKKHVHSESDLPRFTYPVKGSVSDLLQSVPAFFGAFAAEVKGDLQGILDIDDKSAERNLLAAKLSLEELNGEDAEALETIKTARTLEEKPDARLTSDLIDKAIVHARIDRPAGHHLIPRGQYPREPAPAGPTHRIREGEGRHLGADLPRVDARQEGLHCADPWVAQDRANRGEPRCC
jgi:hypothetical protein